MGKFTPVVKQFLAIACCNLLTMSFGLSSGWATINLLELQKENNSLSMEAISPQESSFVVSIVNVGGFVGNFVVLPLSRLIGIKRTIHVLSIPLILGTLLIISAKHIYYLYASRFFIGMVGGGLSVGMPLYILEISYDNVRGALNSLWDPLNNTGIIISYLIGNYLSCIDQAKMQLIPLFIFVIACFFLPESPEFWVQKNKEKKAIKSYRFYKGSICTLNKPEKQEFIAVPQSEIDEKMERGKQNVKEIILTNNNSHFPFKDFCTPHAKNAFFISFSSLIVSFLSGAFTIAGFVTYIFKETGSSLSEKDSSILISITLLTGNLVFLNVVERINRRTLYISSALMTMIGYFSFSIYGHFWLKQPGLEWVSPLCFACIIYSSCLGMSPIPFIISFEIYPTKIRQTCLTIAISIMWIVLFVLGSAFTTFVDLFGIFNCMIVCGIMCLLNALWGIFFMPETRGKSFEEIEQIMNR